MKKVFGTDGIRGRANNGLITPDFMMKLGLAAGTIARRGDHRHTVVIGKDTRLSGYMIEYALTSGLVSAGMDVALVGPVPTPAVGMLTRSLRADLGIMITASHNPFMDNGVKLFGPDGFKISEQEERKIESLVAQDVSSLRICGEKVGQVKAYTDSRSRYIEAAKRAFPAELSLDGLRIGIDAANGAGYNTAPKALWELGADVVSMGVTPNGLNINAGCGSMHPDGLVDLVLNNECDIGIALDGDADRLLIVDETGTVRDGDQILACIAREMLRAGSLRGGGVVATIMSNLGLERYLRSEGLDLIRTKVGDKYVVTRMRSDGFNLGGEQSGHVVLSDHATTGDGLTASLQVLAAMVASGRPASECLSLFEQVPQHMVNVRIDPTLPDPTLSKSVADAIKDTELRLGDEGRLVIRKSGTELLVRVMVECVDGDVAVSESETLAEIVRSAANPDRETGQSVGNGHAGLDLDGQIHAAE